MAVRGAGALTALIGLALFTGEAAAQYDQRYAPGPSRAAQPDIDEDDDDAPLVRPRYGVPGSGYERDTRSARPGDVERRPLYDAGQQPQYQQQPQYSQPQYQQQQPGYATRQDAPPPGVRGPADRGYAGNQDYYWQQRQQQLQQQQQQPQYQQQQPQYQQQARPDVGGGGRPPIDLQPGAQAPQSQMAALPAGEEPELGPAKELPPHLKRQMVDYPSREPAGTLIIDTPNTYLYLVLGNNKAMRYGIGVGREGFTWTGRERVSRMAEWPDWNPPAEMIERQPYLPRFMAGGESNPLGARALYLGKTLYRIHGTNQPSTIGTFVSSGCIRLTNDDVSDLYSRVNVGSQVIVLPGGKPPSAQASAGQEAPMSTAPMSTSGSVQPQSQMQPQSQQLSPPATVGSIPQRR